MSSYRRVLTRYWGVVVAGLIVGLTIAAAITFTTAATYTSQVLFLLSVPGTADPSNAQEKAKTYVELLTIERVGEGVVRSLSLDESPSEFAERVSPRLERDSMIVSARVTDSSPEGAQRIASALGDRFTAVVAELEQPPGTQPGAVPGALTVRVVQPATLPAEPTGPITPINLGLGAILGVVAGVLLALAGDRVRGDQPDGPGEGEPVDAPVAGATVAAGTRPSAGGPDTEQTAGS